MEAITNFDTGIVHRYNNMSVDFSFVVDHVVSPHDLKIEVSDKSHEVIRSYKTVAYLYGRIVIGSESFFAEVVGYVDPECRGIITYHIVFADKIFYETYSLDYSSSDFSSSDFFDFI